MNTQELSLFETRLLDFRQQRPCLLFAVTLKVWQEAAPEPLPTNKTVLISLFILQLDATYDIETLGFDWPCVLRVSALAPSVVTLVCSKTVN